MIHGAQLSNSFILLMALNEAKDPLKSRSPRTWDCGSQRREQVIKFLDTKIKTIEEDPDARWITNWNHYISRIKHFLDGSIMHIVRKIRKVFLLLRT
jgi:hypothetical protein